MNKNGNKTNLLKGGQIGNQNARKPIEKDLAQHATWQELYYASQMMCNTTVEALKRMIADGSIEQESVMTYAIIKRALKGDMKSISWVAEMICGKPKQQMDHTTDMQPIHIKFERVDASNQTS